MSAAPGPGSPTRRPLTPGEWGDPTAWDRLRRWRPTRLGVGIGVLVLAALALLVATVPNRGEDLDPTGVDPQGSRALANILADLGVTVADVRTTAQATDAAPGATVLVTSTLLPTPEMIDSVLDAGPARVVLITPAPGEGAFERLAAGIRLTGTGEDEAVEPGCARLEARRAGSTTLPGLRYDARAWPESSCYGPPESAALVFLAARGPRPEVVLLGSATPLTNGGLDEEGNASLALGLLGAHERLVWWRPVATDPALAGSTPSLRQLLPTWVLPVVLQLLVGCALLAWWRSRRLGRLVIEPLPVVVPAGETSAGEARLLHAQHARGEAAGHLRARACERIRTRLGLSVTVEPRALVAAAAARSARAPGQVGALLYGPEPATDSELATLAGDLEDLMREVGGA